MTCSRTHCTNDASAGHKWCDKCRQRKREWNKKHYAEHPEKEKNHNKKNYAKHRVKRLAWQKMWKEQNPEKVKEQQRRWRLNSKEKIKDYGLRRDHGITIADFNEMLAKQHGKCSNAACDEISGLCVDHCHITGRIRGILCSNCNLAIGNAKDSVARLIGLALYLNKTGTPS
jgi:Recombination endonuclease VII